MKLTDRKRDPASVLAGKYHPVMIRGESYAIRSDRILARAGMGEMMTRPDLSSQIAGFITRRGRLIPVLDLHGELAGGSVPPVEITILIVGSHPDANPGLPVGLWVDEVQEPVIVAATDIRLQAGLTRGADELPCVATVANAAFAVLDLDLIVERSMFPLSAGAR